MTDNDKTRQLRNTKKLLDSNQLRRAAGVRTFVSVKRMRQQTGYDMKSGECEFRTLGIMGRGSGEPARHLALYLLSLRVGRLIFLAAGDQWR